jgi:hypothetical protein
MADDSDDHTMYTAAAAVFPADRLGVEHQGANAKVSAEHAGTISTQVALGKGGHSMADDLDDHSMYIAVAALLTDRLGVAHQRPNTKESLRETRGYHFHPGCCRKVRPFDH